MSGRQRPFKFAVGGSGTADRAKLIEIAREAESMGYSTFLMSDHLLDQFAPLPALVGVAQATTRLRVGTFVLNNDLRHPAVLAQELASVDLLSEGRLDIGIGAGWNLDEYRAAGLTYDRQPVRLERMQEAVRVLKGLFADEPLSFQGAHYTITDMDGRPKPHQRPHPPFIIGAGGRRGLEFAAREAQIVGLAPRLPRPGFADVRSCLADATAEKLGWIREAAGERFDEIEVNTYTALGPVQVTDDALSAAAAVAERMHAAYGVMVGTEELLDSPHLFIGTVEQLVQKCMTLRERFFVSHVLVLGDHKAFAPVVERLAGQ